jgi:hypothetical protein
LRQSDAGKTAAHNHNPLGNIGRDDFVFFHPHRGMASPAHDTLASLSLGRGKMYGVNTP